MASYFVVFLRTGRRTGKSKTVLKSACNGDNNVREEINHDGPPLITVGAVLLFNDPVRK